jgi:AcrR family transcriptional regulator
MDGMSTAAALVGAARRILVEEGAAAVTMRRVAADAGLTPMATYRHFRNREALLAAVVDECFDELGVEWSKRAEIADFDVRRERLLDDFLDFALRTPHLYSYMMIEHREARRFPDDFRDGSSPAFTPVMRLVELGMRTGVLRADDVAETTLVLTALVQGLAQLYLGGRIGMSEPEFRALCHRSIRRVLDGLAT